MNQGHFVDTGCVAHDTESIRNRRMQLLTTIFELSHLTFTPIPISSDENRFRQLLLMFAAATPLPRIPRTHTYGFGLTYSLILMIHTLSIIFKDIFDSHGDHSPSHFTTSCL